MQLYAYNATYHVTNPLHNLITLAQPLLSWFLLTLAPCSCDCYHSSLYYRQWRQQRNDLYDAGDIIAHTNFTTMGATLWYKIWVTTQHPCYKIFHIHTTTNANWFYEHGFQYLWHILNSDWDLNRRFEDSSFKTERHECKRGGAKRTFRYHTRNRHTSTQQFIISPTSITSESHTIPLVVQPG